MLQVIEIGYINHEKPEIRIFLRKRLVKELGKTNHSEIFPQHLERIDMRSVKI
mgnify:CR=1 FL=1